MNTIDILIEGYAKITSTGWDASGTTTLITVSSPVIASEAKQSHIDKEIATDSSSPRNDAVRILVDPGANRDLLLERLMTNDLRLEDIDYVFITHHHLDHAMNVGLFPNAKVVDEEAVYTQAVAVEGVSMLPGTDITVIKTPGHEYAHASLVVPTNLGSVVVAGDCFWFEENQQSEFVSDKGEILDRDALLNKKDDFAQNLDVLIKSRKEILDLADWIIPGHGKIFQNSKRNS